MRPVPKSRMLARKLVGNAVQCLACSRYCRVPDGASGFCGVRSNKGGRLQLDVYGRPCAVWVDPIEKKPLFHFLPGTSTFSIGTFGCNFACRFCQNWDMSQAAPEARTQYHEKWKEVLHEHIEECEEWLPGRIVKEAVKSGCESLSFTYNEPAIFAEYATDVMLIAKKKGLKGNFVTNGYESKECWDSLRGLIDAANIDLKSFSQKFYSQLCAVPSLEPVLESIRYAKKIGLWVEVTTLVIPGLNDSDEELKGIAEFLAQTDEEMPWHVTAFYPNYKMLEIRATPPETLFRAAKIGKEAGLKYVYCGNLPLEFAEHEATICPGCGKAVIRRAGFSIIGNNLVKGNCNFCGHKIKGVWE